MDCDWRFTYVHVHFRWRVALIGKVLYWALLTPLWVNIFQVLEVRPKVSILEDYRKRPGCGQFHLLYYFGPNVQLYGVNNKFCNINLVSGLFQCSVNISLTFFCLYKFYKGSRIGRNT